MGTGSVNSIPNAFDDTVTIGGGVRETLEIINQKVGGFVVRVEANQGGGDIALTLGLESWDPVIGWIPEPLASFNSHPAGVAFKSIDTFKTTQSEKYKVTMTPTGGTSGPVKIVVSMQTQQ